MYCVLYSECPIREVLLCLELHICLRIVQLTGKVLLDYLVFENLIGEYHLGYLLLPKVLNRRILTDCN